MTPLELATKAHASLSFAERLDALGVPCGCGPEDKGPLAVRARLGFVVGELVASMTRAQVLDAVGYLYDRAKEAP